MHMPIDHLAAQTPDMPFIFSEKEEYVATNQSVVKEILSQNELVIEEDIDGASVGVCYHKGEFYVRRRLHLLNENIPEDHPTEKQFQSFWGWLEDHTGQFQLLNRMEPFSEENPAVIYGKWCWMAHGIHYTDLPSFFIACDLYDARSETVLYDRWKVRKMLRESRFEVPKTLYTGHGVSEHYLARLSCETSQYYKGKVKGFYLHYPNWLNHCDNRFKMTRHDFKNDEYIRENEIIRNLLKKS